MFITVSFHNFKSQNFNSSVSNPKSKYVAYVSVLSQISNCQGLGRKNKHEILKTDRMQLDLPWKAVIWRYPELALSPQRKRFRKIFQKLFSRG